MNLCVDVGNTTIGFGVFDENNLILKMKFQTDRYKTETEFSLGIKDLFIKNKFDINKIDKIIYSSVVPLVNHPLKSALIDVFKCKVMSISSGIKTGIMMKIDNPNELGNDLVAGKNLYSYPLLIVDLGTASKILLIDKDGYFSSALIMPGLFVSANALTDSTKLLPSVGLESSRKFLAKNTIEAINNGLLYGHSEMIKGLINRFEEELGYKCKVILSGGASFYLKDLLPSSYIYEQDLVLKGLNILLNKNWGNLK